MYVAALHHASVDECTRILASSGGVLSRLYLVGLSLLARAAGRRHGLRKSFFSDQISQVTAQLLCRTAAATSLVHLARSLHMERRRIPVRSSCRESPVGPLAPSRLAPGLPVASVPVLGLALFMFMFFPVFILQRLGGRFSSAHLSFCAWW